MVVLPSDLQENIPEMEAESIKLANTEPRFAVSYTASGRIGASFLRARSAEVAERKAKFLLKCLKYTNVKILDCVECPEINSEAS